MPVSLTTLTGPIYMPNGATPIGGRVSFELSSWDQEEGEGLIITGPVYSTIDQNGQFSVQLYTSTAGINSVHYRMFVIWEDSELSESYVNNIYLGTPTPHYTKKYIGSFALSGLGPFQVSDLNIISETNNSSFDAYLEMKAFIDRIDLGVLDSAVASTTDDAAQVALDKIATDANRVQTGLDRIQTGQDAEATTADALAADAARVLAETARDAAIAAGAWDYRPADGTALAAITGMTTGETALVLSTMHVWQYSGSVWVDTGVSPLDLKANKTALPPMLRAAATESAGLAALTGAGQRFILSDLSVFESFLLNLYNPAAKRVDKLVSVVNGTIQPGVGWACSEFIPVTAGQSYTISNNTTRQHGLAFFSAASDSAVVSYINTTGTPLTVTVPVGATHMALTVKSPTYSEPTQLMVTPGASARAWVVYGTLGATAVNTVVPNVTTDVVSANLYNPGAKRAGKFINSASGLIQSAAGWTVSGFIAVTAGTKITISGNAARQQEVAFFTSAGDSAVTGFVAGGGTGTRTLTVPAGATHMAMMVQSPTYPEPTEIMAVVGAVAQNYVAFGAVTHYLMAEKLWPVAVKAAQLTLSGAGTSFVSCPTTGVRQEFVAFPTPQLRNFPSRFNLGKVFLGDLALRNGTDDIAPDVIGGLNLLANHGYIGGVVTATAHGKTSADQGSTWSNGGVTVVLIEVITANTLLMARIDNDTVPTSGTWVHVAGAINTASITAASVALQQWYPPHAGRTITTYVDGVLVAETSGVWDYDDTVRFVETVYLVRRADVIAWIIANDGAPAGVEPTGTRILSHTVTYVFDRDAQLTITSQWLALADVALSYLRGAQLGWVAGPGASDYFIPGALPINYSGTPYDYSMGVSSILNQPGGSTTITLTTATCQASGECANRVVQLWSAQAFAVGLLPINDAAYDVRRTRVSRAAMQISPITCKVYLRTLDTADRTMVAGEAYTVTAYRHIHARVADRTDFYTIRHDGEAWVFADWHNKSGLDLLTMPADLIGRPCEVIEAVNVTTPVRTIGREVAAYVAAPTGRATLILRVT